MNNILEAIISIIAILSAVALPIGLGMYIAIRSMSQKHIERMEMIKQGLMPPEENKAAPNRAKTLKKAISFIGVGVGLAVGLLIINFMKLDDDASPFVIGASILLFLGISSLIYFFLSKKIFENEEK